MLWQSWMFCEHDLAGIRVLQRNGFSRVLNLLGHAVPPVGFSSCWAMQCHSTVSKSGHGVNAYDSKADLIV
jgi:hypothetical protein